MSATGAGKEKRESGGARHERQPDVRRGASPDEPPAGARSKGRSAFIERANAAPFYALTGLRAESDKTGAARVTLPFDPKLTQLYGAIHGGALMAVCDAAISMAIATTLEEGERIATTELSVSFVAAAGENDVVGHGEVTRRGRTLAFGRCELVAGGRVVATAQGIWHIGRD